MFQLRATDLMHSYGSRRVLGDGQVGVSLTVSGIESVALMGPSGSGKSTLLSMLGGLATPAEGEVVIDVDTEPGRSVFGWVLQTNTALGSRSVWENVKIGAVGLRSGADTESSLVASAIDQCGLAPLSKRRAKTLSGGELQRVSIARALASQPFVLLADEPTGQLDRATSDMVLDSLFTPERDYAVVVATHDPLVAARCDRTVMLVDGMLVDDRATAADAATSPAGPVNGLAQHPTNEPKR